MNREDIKEFNVNREYILHNQPFAPGTFPPQYVPHRPTKWYPPMFCLGVALSTKETEDFARHLGLTVDERGSMVAYGIAGHLTRVCGADPQVTLQRCDQGGPFKDRVWLFSLVNNYHNPSEIHGKGSLDKYREIVEGAFGSSKQVMWWLEYTMNHTPTHWWVSTKTSTVFAVIHSIC